MRARELSIAFLDNMTSASIKRMYLEMHILAPEFLPCEGKPPLIIFIFRLCNFLKFRMIFRVLSVEPASAMIIGTSFMLCDCNKRELNSFGRNFSSFLQGITMLNSLLTGIKLN